MTEPRSAADGGDSHVAAYEELRRQALMGSYTYSNIGLTLLLREGVAAWMTHRSNFAAPAVRPQERLVPTLAPISDETQTSLVRTLASMALGGREEMRA